MSVSYSGVVGYGKVTLPSVESWGTSMNILRDPPKSITTRKIDKVGETSYMPNLMAESGDRICENISYYPKGTNPMVSVSYNNSGARQAFLPYRIMRDGAFRPPIRGQEDLLPLSRMPRIWTTVDTQPYAPDFTKRILSCRDAEHTREVKNFILNKEWKSCKKYSLQPGANEPRIVGMISSSLNPGDVNAQKSCNVRGIAEAAITDPMRKFTLLPNRPVAVGSTNKCGETRSTVLPKVVLAETTPFSKDVSTNASSKDRPQAVRVPDIRLENNRPAFQHYRTNSKFIREKPQHVNYALESNRPAAVATTNRKMPCSSQMMPPMASLRDKIHPESTGPSFSIPRTTTFVPAGNLTKVR